MMKVFSRTVPYEQAHARMLEQDGDPAFICSRCANELNFPHAADCARIGYWSKKIDGADFGELFELHEKGCTCGADALMQQASGDFVLQLWGNLFRCPETHRGGTVRLPAEFPWPLCRVCAEALTPTVVKFADIWLTNIYNQRLMRKIRERKQK